MFCSQCGAKNADDVIFCQKCGKRLGTTGQVEPTLYSPPATVPASPYESTAYGSTEPNTPPPPPPVLPYSGLSNPYEQQSPLVAPPLKQKSRRVRWLVLSITGVVILLLIGLGAYLYATRSTPSKTLTTACDALKNRDFQTLSNQWASNYSRTALRQSFSAFIQGENSQGGFNSCTFTNPIENGSSATTVGTITFGNGAAYSFNETLITENGIWKISNSVPIK